jgi:hypothetical protein
MMQINVWILAVLVIGIVFIAKWWGANRAS